MSKAETLAYDLEAEVITHEVADKAAAELRRLAQVEAEHAALLKAISDAEPVGTSTPMSGTVGGFTIAVFRGTDVPVDTPLYTLNGIKKP